MSPPQEQAGLIHFGPSAVLIVVLLTLLVSQPRFLVLFNNFLFFPKKISVTERKFSKRKTNVVKNSLNVSSFIFYFIVKMISVF